MVNRQTNFCDTEKTDLLVGRCWMIFALTFTEGYKGYC